MFTHQRGYRPGTLPELRQDEAVPVPVEALQTLRMPPPAPAVRDRYVDPEDAPLGVQLWPAKSPASATVTAVALVRAERERGTFVVWTMRDGTTRRYRLGEAIRCCF
jgi:hypothetical protein